MNPFDFFLPFLSVMEQLFVLFDRGTGNFGITILLFTAATRLLLYPLSVPSLKAAKKMQELKPHMDKLKERHGNDKKALAAAQMDLYKQHGVNPAAGCLPQILQIFILISLYQVFMKAAGGNLNGHTFNMTFFWMDLAKPDQYYVLPALAGITQLALSLMMMPKGSPQGQNAPAVKEASGKSGDMGAEMQKQMAIMFPLMTVFISLKFPSGLSLYWVATTVFSIVQQYKIAGLGGLEQYMVKLKSIANRK